MASYPPDVVYLVRDGDNPELRYSLRSLANVRHGTVWIVGYKPVWVTGVEYVSVSQDRDRYANTLAAVRAACTNPDITQVFQLWNDDFFALRPTAIPNWHRGPIECTHRSNVPTHLAGQNMTARLLRKWGIDPVLNYAIHVPMLINREKMLVALKRASRSGIKALHRRTLYGNLWQVGGEEHKDVGFVNQRDVPDPGQVWVATNDQSFKLGEVGRVIRDRLPDPSPYEGDR